MKKEGSRRMGTPIKIVRYGPYIFPRLPSNVTDFLNGRDRWEVLATMREDGLILEFRPTKEALAVEDCKEDR